MQDVPFDGWSGVGRILIAAPLVYIAVIAMIRVSGKRSTAQINNFDWIVTVAMGSLVASCLVTETVTIVEALTAIAALLALQYLATALAWCYGLAVKLIKSTPRLLFDSGFLTDAMREAGFAHQGDVRWVILETDGSFSVLPHPDEAASPDALANVPAAP
jgi:uncharacterized membrane protein YcaP (DUF421 family)